MPGALRDLATQHGPFTSVSIDGTRTDPAAPEEIALRFREQAERLAARGAPSADIDALADAITALPGRGGPLTRLAVARGAEVVLDEALPGKPPRDESTFGPAPHLLPALRAAVLPAPYLVVEADRAGADISVVTEFGETAEAHEIEGSHDQLHKVREGGWSHRRIQMRAQDSWDRNADEIARELDRAVAQIAPAAVLISGDPYEVGALTRAVQGATRDLVVPFESGGRAGGISQHARRAAIASVVEDRARADKSVLLDRFAAAEARQQEAVQGLSAVVEALQRGQVATVFLRDDPTSTATLWTGPEPLQIGEDRGTLTSMGVRDPVRMRADTIVTRALIASDARLILLDDGDADFVDGIGALLRWSDMSTAHDAVPAMPGHGQAPDSGSQA